MRKVIAKTLFYMAVTTIFLSPMLYADCQFLAETDKTVSSDAAKEICVTNEVEIGEINSTADPIKASNISQPVKGFVSEFFDYCTTYEYIPVEPKVTLEMPEFAYDNLPLITFIGDSRMVGQQIGNPNSIYVCEGGQAYPWLMKEETQTKIELAAEYSDIFVFNLGVNGFYDPKLYMNYLMDFCTRHPDKMMIYMSVNPVDDEKAQQYGYTVSDNDVQNYNAQLLDSLPENVLWLDTYTLLTTYGFDTFDGIHYTNQTYRDIYDYTMYCISEWTECDVTDELQDKIDRYHMSLSEQNMGDSAQNEELEDGNL